MLTLMAGMVVSGLLLKRGMPDARFLTVYADTLGVALFFNTWDLVVLDWLIFCTITPKFLVIPGTDGKKMSKSYGNTIPLFAPKDVLAKAVMGIVTDSAGDRPENVYAIHKLVKSEAELATLYEEKRGKYKDLKEALIEDLESYFGTMREKRESITDEHVATVLAAGAAQARQVSEGKMRDVRRAVGVA